MRRAIACLLAAAAVGLVSPDARACGGCFAPPALPQVVTEHRMVLSLSAQQTTLWDQFRFSGRPEEFSWILPLRYTDALRIAVGHDAFLAALAEASAPALPLPPYPWPRCPYNPAPSCWSASQPGPATTQVDGDRDAGLVQDAPSPADAGPPPVQVLRQEVVGPFEVRVIRGDDPMALRVWLATNGYAVPAAIEPVLAHYTALSMDFLALRLRPAQGVDRIAPVRITFPGHVPRLPLRMIAAGVGDRVGLKLYVLAEGRVEAANFPNDEYVDDDFLYDWAARPWVGPDEARSLFDAAFARHRAAMGARLWLTESSDEVARGSLESFAAPWERVLPAGAGADAGSLQAARPSDDLRVAFEHLGARAQLTRLRADFPGAMLDRDLELAASDRGVRGRTYAFGRQTNLPPPPRCADGSYYDPAVREFVGASPWPPCPPRSSMPDPVPAAPPAAAPPAVAPSASCRAAPGAPHRALPAFALALLAATAWRSRRRPR